MGANAPNQNTCTDEGKAGNLIRKTIETLLQLVFTVFTVPASLLSLTL